MAFKYFIAKRKLGPEPWREAFWCVFTSHNTLRPVCVADSWQRCVWYVVDKNAKRRERLQAQLRLRLEPEWRKIP